MTERGFYSHSACIHEESTKIALLRNNTGLCSVTFSAVNSNGKWQFWIDRGGTFTDVVAVRPDGALETAKLLSENPERYNDAAAAGISEILQHWADAGHADAPLLF